MGNSMRTIRNLLVAVLLLGCVQAEASIARVGTPASGTAVASSSLPVSQTCTAGNFLAFWIWDRNGTGNPVASVTDDGASGGSTWAFAFNQSVNGARTMALAYTLSCKSGITTITATLNSGSITSRGVVAEYSGVGSGIDAGPSADAYTASTSSLTTNAIAPTGSDLELAMFGAVNGFLTWTITAPFASVNQGNDPSLNDTILAADQINASTTTANATLSLASAADGIMVTFRPAAAVTTRRISLPLLGVQ